MGLHLLGYACMRQCSAPFSHHPPFGTFIEQQVGRAGAASKVGSGTNISIEEVQQRAKEVIDNVQDPNKPLADALPEDVLGKVTDLLTDTLGNGRM